MVRKVVIVESFSLTLDGPLQLDSMIIKHVYEGATVDNNILYISKPFTSSSSPQEHELQYHAALTDPKRFLAEADICLTI